METADHRCYYKENRVKKFIRRAGAVFIILLLCLIAGDFGYGAGINAGYQMGLSDMADALAPKTKV